MIYMNTNDVFDIVNEHNVLTINSICTAQICAMTCANANMRATEKRKKQTLKTIIKAILPLWMVESPAHLAMGGIMLMSAISAIVLVIMDFTNIIRFGYIPELYDVWMPMFFAALAAISMITGKSEK